MTVEFARIGDIDRWMDLLELVQDYFPGLERDAYRQGLEACINNREALVAKQNGLLVGALIFSAEHNELAFLAVHPDHRRQGIAQALIKRMIELFPDGTAISVITYREGDPLGDAARKLYLDLGFQTDELLMVFDYPCQKLVYIV